MGRPGTDRPEQGEEESAGALVVHTGGVRDSVVLKSEAVQERVQTQELTTTEANMQKWNRG